MNGLSIKRVWILSEAKFKSFYYNKLIGSYLIFPMGIALAIQFLNERINNRPLSLEELTMCINIGAVLNVSYVAYVTPATLLAEEKEKNTLRVLMVSSISGLEFFLGNLLPIVVVSSIVQAVIVPLLGIQFSVGQFAMYLLVSLVGIVSSAVLGMCFGILSKNQMNATLITIPLTMLLIFIPMLKNLSLMMMTISDNLYTGVLMKAIPILVANQPFSLSFQNWAVLMGELLLSVGWFLWLYSRNGFDKD
ncbi:ABC transporter permease [Listeria innocua]|uniref:ABC transporter permease n=1 Tax=Listeria innocua TaxID=1642 RepID=UPI00162AD14A|nr:ABC transporter permease [Listeria innocua]EBF5204563.1 ABC transporter permease [Listeria monocytogenes]MBC2140560.1 ABC transporter permease [Listeria innocua]